MTYILRTNNLSKKYRNNYVLKKLNINVKKGEIYGFIGKNGAGKTTLIRLVMGLLRKSEGSIELFGKDSQWEVAKARNRIGVLIETPAFYGDMSAYDNLELVRLQRGIPGKECIKEKLELVGLKDIGSKKVKDFSLGMKEKLGIAMALLGDPEFLILDEPTNGLDPMGIVQIRELLKKLNKEKGVTILISSHLLSEVYQMATSYGIINNGELAEELSKNELEEKCRRHIEIKVDDCNKTAWVIENNLKTYNYKVMTNNIIKIYDYIQNPEVVAKELSKEEVLVSQIMVKGDDLEEYFMNLIGGVK